MTRLRNGDPDRNRILTQLRKLICDTDGQKIQCCPINLDDNDQINSSSTQKKSEDIITDKVLFAIFITVFENHKKMSHFLLIFKHGVL